MSEPVVKLAPALAKYTVHNGPMEVELRSAPNGLKQLAAGIIRFDEGGSTDPWRLPYEEALFVMDGRLRLHVDATTVVVDPGEVVTIPRGATVVYEGDPGTRAFYALTPADWYKTHPHGL
jgi:ethanolamine utilization protein EutQ